MLLENKDDNMKRYYHIYSLTMADIDPNNRMTPMAVLSYFQDAIGRFLSLARVSALDLVKEGATWMITEFHATFSDELPSWPGIVSVEVFLSEISSVRSHVDFIVRDNKGSIVSRGTSIWVMIDLASRRIIPCSQNQRFVDQYDEANHTSYTRYIFPFPNMTLSCPTDTHTVTPLDTDFNDHVSNRDYFRMAMAMAMADLQEPEKKMLSAVHVKFLQETHVGEVLSCFRHSNQTDILNVWLTKNGCGEVACQMVAEWRPTS